MPLARATLVRAAASRLALASLSFSLLALFAVPTHHDSSALGSQTSTSPRRMPRSITRPSLLLVRHSPRRTLSPHSGPRFLPLALWLRTAPLGSLCFFFRSARDPPAKDCHAPRLAPKRMSEVVSPIFGKILCIYEGKGKRWYNNTKVRSLSPPISLGFTGFPGWWAITGGAGRTRSSGKMGLMV